MSENFLGSEPLSVIAIAAYLIYELVRAWRSANSKGDVLQGKIEKNQEEQIENLQNRINHLEAVQTEKDNQIMALSVKLAQIEAELLFMKKANNMDVT